MGMFGSIGKALGGALPGLNKLPGMGGGGAAPAAPMAGTAPGSVAPAGGAPPLAQGGLGGLLKGAAGAGVGLGVPAAGGGVGAMNRAGMAAGGAIPGGIVGPQMPGGGLASKLIAQNPGLAQMAQTPKAQLAQQPGLAQGPEMQGAVGQMQKRFGMKRSMRGGKR